MQHQQPIFVHTTEGMYIRPSIEDLSCNHINIQTQEAGSLHVISYPTGARICINNMPCSITEATVNNIPSSTSGISHNYKLTYPGYIDVEGSIKIYTGQVSELVVVMKPSPCPSTNMLLYVGLFALGFILFSSRKKEKEENKRYIDKYE